MHFLKKALCIIALCAIGSMDARVNTKKSPAAAKKTSVARQIEQDNITDEDIRTYLTKKLDSATIRNLDSHKYVANLTTSAESDLGVNKKRIRKLVDNVVATKRAQIKNSKKMSRPKQR